jgi:uncharacterized protein (DUF433 family)
MLGTGIYTPDEAATLLHESSQTVRRWAFGYTRNRRAGRVEHPPLINTDLPEVEGSRALTFIELVELLYVRAFQRAGVPWGAIKEAARTASRLYCSPHPFALRQFFVDPKRVYAAIPEADGSESLVELIGAGQNTIAGFVKPYVEQIEFVEDVAARWYPIGRHEGVVIDPRFAYGAPIIEEHGIRAQTLSRAVAAERRIHGDDAVERVAWTYGVGHKHVHAALRFESWLSEKAA